MGRVTEKGGTWVGPPRSCPGHEGTGKASQAGQVARATGRELGTVVVEGSGSSHLAFEAEVLLFTLL